MSEGITPIRISANHKSELTNVISGTSDFYFWGKSPSHSDVDLEDLSNRLGLSYPSYVSVEQTTGWKSFFFTVITLGLYSPVDYKITVLSAKDSQR